MDSMDSKSVYSANSVYGQLIDITIINIRGQLHSSNNSNLHMCNSLTLQPHDPLIRSGFMVQTPSYTACCVIPHTDSPQDNYPPLLSNGTLRGEKNIVNHHIFAMS